MTASVMLWARTRNITYLRVTTVLYLLQSFIFLLPYLSLADKIKRLETLLTKCKESIKANKQKTQALTEVKESLSTQLSEREAECEKLKTQVHRQGKKSSAT